MGLPPDWLLNRLLALLPISTTRSLLMEPAPVEDAVLVERLQHGDESVLGLLMQRHQTHLHYFTLRYLNDPSLASEVTQETFVRAYFNIGKYRPTASFKTWLYTIAVNLCRDHARQKARRPLFVSIDESTDKIGPSSVVNTLAAATSPTSEFETDERHALVESAIAKLPPDLRESLLLFCFEGLSQKECANIVGVTPKTVELRVYRAKKELQTTLASFLSDS